MIKDLITFNRSYRRFHEDQKIDKEFIISVIELARLSPSPRNLQPYKFIISTDQELNSVIFPHLAWAGYLLDWAGPEPGERPAAYIIILDDSRISGTLDKENLHYGCGIVVQSILLGLSEQGIGGCIIASVQRRRLADEFKLGNEFNILLVLAIGKPKEEIKIEKIDESGSIKYWRDDDAVHHVPKRELGDLILNAK
jgi:nitroreductase